MPDPQPSPTRRSLLVALGLVPVLVACGSSPDPQAPGGVDGLVIPTPSPDPADFVGTIDNPWLPLSPGSAWEYAVRPGGPAAVRAVVAEEGRVIAGVATTCLVWTRGPREVTRAWFAQDRRGDVWQLGGEVIGASAWAAGSGGALAGLAMPAAPRRGDGFRAMLAPGVAEDRLTVVAVDAEPPGDLDDRWAGSGMLLLERRVLGATAAAQEYHRSGVGLVARTDGAGATGELLLLDHTGSG